MAAAELTPFYYDLHIHTCLSPCGENDMTPATVAGLSALAGLDIIAICDHNTAGNVQAVQQAAAALAPGLLVIPGIELTCAEELHMVCLFPTAEDLRRPAPHLQPGGDLRCPAPHGCRG